MQTPWIVAVMVVAGAIFLRLWRSRRAEKNIEWPPGPSKLPIIGNLHQLRGGGKLIHVTLAKMAEEHGTKMTVWFGAWTPIIIASDYDAVWEVLVTKSSTYASRDQPYWMKFFTANWNTMAVSDYGPYWHALRRGLHNSALNPINISAQTHLQESEIRATVDYLGSEASQNSGVVGPMTHLRMTTIRLMARLLFGSEFKNEEFVETMNTILLDMAWRRRYSIIESFPFARHIPGLNLHFKLYARLQHKIECLIRPLLSLITADPNRSYLYFLKSQNLPDQVIVFNLFELFSLSVDSTSIITTWALGFLIHNQGIQEKVYEEIKRMCKGSWVRVEEVRDMKYIQAVAKETMRMKPIAPLGIPHKTREDTTLTGTKIRAGSIVMVNLHTVLNDPKVWVEPQVFMPERWFLPGMEVMEEYFLSFGGGRRVCPGMELAKLQVPLVLANLVQAYHWCGVDGRPPDMTEELIFGLEPKTPLAARIEPRLF